MAEDGLGRTAESALELVEEEFKRQGVDLEAAVLVVLAKDREPNAGSASMFDVEEGTSDEEVLAAMFELLLAATGQTAQRAGIRFAVGQVGGRG